MKRKDRVSKRELVALGKKLEARAPLSAAEYEIITAVIKKTFAWQRIHDAGREPTAEELEDLRTIPRPEKADG